MIPIEPSVKPPNNSSPSSLSYLFIIPDILNQSMGQLVWFSPLAGFHPRWMNRFNRRIIKGPSLDLGYRLGELP